VGREARAEMKRKLEKRPYDGGKIQRLSAGFWIGRDSFMLSVLGLGRFIVSSGVCLRASLYSEYCGTMIEWDIHVTDFTINILSSSKMYQLTGGA
jgi:hypothetical protein